LAARAGGGVAGVTGMTTMNRPVWLVTAGMASCLPGSAARPGVAASDNKAATNDGRKVARMMMAGQSPLDLADFFPAAFSAGLSVAAAAGLASVAGLSALAAAL
jgi:hypothetical protein